MLGRVTGWVAMTVCGSAACVDRGAVFSAKPATEDVEIIAGLEPAVAQMVSAGEQHTCAFQDGIAYCWGDDMYGQIGNGSTGGRTGPSIVARGNWQSITAGESHSCALDQTGDVYCWGRNDRGQLGQGNREDSSLPERVPLPSAATALAGGFNHYCVILSDDQLWCWGDGNEGQLGRGDIFPGSDSRDADALAPELVQSPDATTSGRDVWRAVNTGQGHTCALQMDNSLWCWGRNSGRQLGQPSELGQVREPTRVGAGHRWVMVDAGQNHTCALEADHTLWCWGYNMGWIADMGNPLGLPAQQVDVPTRVVDSEWLAFSTNMFHTCALDAAAGLWCWGRNQEGQLALDMPPLQHTPVQVATGVAAVSTGRFSTCTVSFEGELACAGNNDRGQLGGSEYSTESQFVAVVLPAPAEE